MSVQTGEPVVHTIAASRQGFEAVQAIPAVQATQTPPGLHTPMGHAVPAVMLVVSVQPGAPLVHTIDALSHRLAEAHAVPATHTTQLPAAAPLTQTPPAHAVPGARLVPVSAQTDVPDVQAVAPA